jgi:hypothetical protein
MLLTRVLNLTLLLFLMARLLPPIILLPESFRCCAGSFSERASLASRIAASMKNESDARIRTLFGYTENSDRRIGYVPEVRSAPLRSCVRI